MGKSTRTAFVVGDYVTIINMAEFTGLHGVVVEVKGLVREKYIVRLNNGIRTPPLFVRYLTRDKRY